MRKKWAFFLLCLFTLASLSYIWISPGEKTPAESSEHFKYKYGSYFFPLSISKFTLSKLPCLPIEVNGEVVSAMLDLGFRGQFSFSPEFLEHLENKKYLGSKKMYGIRGIEREEKLYEVPKIGVGPISFTSPVLHETVGESHEESTVMKEGNEPSPPEPGRVGWELFGNTNLLLDLANSKIALCDSLETLKKEGYATEKFVKIPLLLGRGLVELYAETPEGRLLCMLDTGATYNVLNVEIQEGRSIEQMAQEPEKMLRSFKLNGIDFGPVAFHCIPIKIPIHIEAILGMEFFQDHVVFLDFLESQAYIASTSNLVL